jgi:molybdate transport system ATP-binding protein
VFLAPHKRSLGYVFQEASLFAHLTVKGNLEFGLKRIAAKDRASSSSRPPPCWASTICWQRQPDKLSGGERQRVGIARALLTSPRLLLLDEPLAALDAHRKGEILPYLERLHDELDIPMLYVSHSQDEVARLADHLVLLSDGKALASGPIGETLARLDLPLAMGDDAGVVIEGKVSAYDADLPPAHRTPAPERPVDPRGPSPLESGKPLRFKIQARDVSLNLQPDEHSSILNRLPVTVVEAKCLRTTSLTCWCAWMPPARRCWRASRVIRATS